MTEEPIICRVHHIRATGVCAAGIRAWFTDRGLSWSDFLENGIPVEQAEAMDDSFASEVAAIARAEAAS